MVKATSKAENIAVGLDVAEDAELKLYNEKLEMTRQHYEALKARYEDAGSKLFKNSWFKTKEVDPALVSYEASLKVVQAKRAELAQYHQRDDVTLLKVIYRLGLVFLSMVLIHSFCDRLQPLFE